MTIVFIALGGAAGAITLLVGFLSAYTTFSTLMLDSWRLVEDGLPALAVANLAGSMILASWRSSTGSGSDARSADPGRRAADRAAMPSDRLGPIPAGQSAAIERGA